MLTVGGMLGSVTVTVFVASVLEPDLRVTVDVPSPQPQNLLVTSAGGSCLPASSSSPVLRGHRVRCSGDVAVISAATPGGLRL